MGGHRGGGEVELPGQLGRGGRYREQALQDRSPAVAQRRPQRRRVGRRGRGGPQVRDPAGAVRHGGTVARLDEHLHAGPGEDAGHEGDPASGGLDDRLVGGVRAATIHREGLTPTTPTGTYLETDRPRATKPTAPPRSI